MPNKWGTECCVAVRMDGCHGEIDKSQSVFLSLVACLSHLPGSSLANNRLRAITQLKPDIRGYTQCLQMYKLRPIFRASLES